MLMGGGFLQAPPSFPSQQALLSHSRPTRSLRAETIRQPQATSSDGCGINHTAACPLTSDAFSNLTILLSSQIPASESSANRLGQGADRSLLDCSTAPPLGHTFADSLGSVGQDSPSQLRSRRSSAGEAVDQLLSFDHWAGAPQLQPEAMSAKALEHVLAGGPVWCAGSASVRRIQNLSRILINSLSIESATASLYVLSYSHHLHPSRSRENGRSVKPPRGVSDRGIFRSRCRILIPRMLTHSCPFAAAASCCQKLGLSPSLRRLGDDAPEDREFVMKARKSQTSDSK